MGNNGGVGYEAETKGLADPGKVSKIDNQKGKFKLPHIGWNRVKFKKKVKYLKIKINLYVFCSVMSLFL